MVGSRPKAGWWSGTEKPAVTAVTPKAIGGLYYFSVHLDTAFSSMPSDEIRKCPEIFRTPQNPTV